MRVHKKKGSVLTGIFILSIASLFTKFLSAFYRVPFQNMAGDLGFYVYQQIYPLYGVVAILSMYGFPIVLSKQRASLLAEGKVEEAKNVTSVLFYGLLSFAFLSWIMTYVSAGFLADVMGDAKLKQPIQAMSGMLLLLPFLSVGRGFHQGNEELVSTAFSHVFEQLVRVVLIIGFTFYFLKMGADAYQIGKGASYGSILAGVSGILVLIMATKGAWLKEIIPLHKLRLLTMLKSYKSLFYQSAMICLSALVLVLFQLIDALSVIRLLELFGLEMSKAFLEKGVYDRGQPLIQLGTVVTTTFSLALVPMLSRAIAERRTEAANRYQHLSYRIALVIGGAATIGLIIIIEPTNRMLFTTAAGSDVLKVFVLSIFLHAFYVTLTAILQGYHLVKYPAWAAVIGVCIKVILNVLLIPAFGVIGAAWATVGALGIMVIYLLITLYFSGHLTFGPCKPYLYIFLLLITMGVITYLWMTWLQSNINAHTRTTDAVVSLSAASLGGALVVICLFVFPVFSQEEWEQIPVLGRLRKLIKRSLKHD